MSEQVVFEHIGDVDEDRRLSDWPLRPWVLAALLGLAGLLIHLLTDNAEQEPWRAAAAAFVFFGSIAAAFTLAPRRLLEAGLFALAIGLVMGGIAFHTVEMESHIAGEEYAFAAGVFFTLLALPLFQAGFHRTRLATDYSLTHFHVWADAVSGAGAIAFTGLSWLLLLLLDQLFQLVGIDIIGELFDESWFGFTWTGAAFGAALGVLRNNLKIVGALQNVVLLVISLLAVPLALALVVFLVALLASGGQALWDATDAATPVLLACAAGSFVFLNAIIRDSDAARSGNRVMQIAAAVLAAGILPLAVFAAISMGIRIGQYGLAPERLWALIAIAVAVAYGIAGWVALARGRFAGWSEALQQANMRLAAGVCVLALILALPLFDFGAISARNQVARLEGGKVPVEEFDFSALRWDFGDAGRAMLERLAAGEGEVAELASAALQQQSQPPYWDRNQRPDRAYNLRVQPNSPALRALILERLRAEPWRCQQQCVALDLGTDPQGQRRVALVEGGGFEVLPLGENGGTEPARRTPPEMPELRANSTVEIRTVPTRYIYIDGVRVRGPVEERMEIPPMEVTPAAPAPPAPPPPPPAPPRPSE